VADDHAGQARAERAPDDVAGEFVGCGTATAPPVYLMVALAVLTLLAPSRGWWRTLAVVGLCILAALTLVGSLREALAPPTPGVTRAVLLASGVVGVLLVASLFLSGVLELVDR